MKKLFKKAKKHWWKILVGSALVVTGNEIVGVPILKDALLGEKPPVAIESETKTDTAVVAPVQPKEDDE